ncbi:hypothetical protein ACFFX0_11580 [Citricoccus parietis]|uniref:Uncharacterized protein n=1 Tax=Citricoccus parietis TaxID=592307 RepID=A0ABV5FYP6_9MICC
MVHEGRLRPQRLERLERADRLPVGGGVGGGVGVRVHSGECHGPTVGIGCFRESRGMFRACNVVLSPPPATGVRPTSCSRYTRDTAGKPPAPSVNDLRRKGMDS